MFFENLNLGMTAGRCSAVAKAIAERSALARPSAVAKALARQDGVTRKAEKTMVCQGQSYVLA
jgi:hypothetical protein